MLRVFFAVAQGMKTSSCEATSSPSKLRWITPEADWAARSPKFSPDGTRLLFVNAAKSAAHFSCSELKVRRGRECGSGFGGRH